MQKTVPLSFAVALAAVAVIVGGAAGFFAGYLAAKPLASKLQTTGEAKAPDAKGAEKEAAPEIGAKITAIKIRTPDHEFTVRGTCELSTEFLGDFRASRGLAYSIRISQPDPPDHMFLYIDRSDPDSEKVYRALSTGPKTMTFLCLLTRNIDVAQVRKVVSLE